jgi:hypothetical protein
MYFFSCLAAQCGLRPKPAVIETEDRGHAPND